MYKTFEISAQCYISDSYCTSNTFQYNLQHDSNIATCRIATILSTYNDMINVDFYPLQDLFYHIRVIHLCLRNMKRDIANSWWIKVLNPYRIRLA